MMPSADDVQPWDSDHTALVHVLWEADHKGLALQDYDELAALIMQSKWMAATRIHQREQGESIPVGERFGRQLEPAT